MIDPLYKGDTATATDYESNEGERTLLYSNESGLRSPSLDLEGTHTPEEGRLVKELAEILVEGFLWMYEQEYNQQQQTGSDLLPGINERAS